MSDKSRVSDVFKKGNPAFSMQRDAKGEIAKWDLEELSNGLM